MTLHFAYGSNMSRVMMRSHAPEAKPLGVATLQGFRFLIMADGYASVERAVSDTVYGVLWRITPRDRVTLDAWENIGAGLYRAEMLPVRPRWQTDAGAGLSRTHRPSRPSQAGLHKGGHRSCPRLGTAGRLHSFAPDVVAGAVAQRAGGKDRKLRMIEGLG